MNPQELYPDIKTTFVPKAMHLENILGDHKRKRFLEDWWAYSAILGRWFCIPKGFVFDEESIPLLKGSNPEAGGVHDYFCRKDSDPVVSKTMAAKLYFEFQAYFDEMESGNWFNRAWDWTWRGFKSNFVKVWPGFYHKFKVMATYEEITA